MMSDVEEIIHDTDMYNMASGEEIRKRADSDPTCKMRVVFCGESLRCFYCFVGANFAVSMTAGYTGPIENIGGSADTYKSGVYE